MSLRRSIRTLVYNAAIATGMVAWRERELHGTLTVLMYHRVLPDELWQGSPLPGLVMPLSAFEAQCRYLSQRYDVVTLAEGVDRLNAGRPGSSAGKPLLSITFDDGYRDNHQHAAPVLAAHGLPATFFLVSGFVGSDVELWFDQAARWFKGAMPGDIGPVVRHAMAMRGTGSSGSSFPSSPPWSEGDKPDVRTWMTWLKNLYQPARFEALMHMHDRNTLPRRECDKAMSVDQARDLLWRGHEIGAHTVTHPLLPQENDEDLRREVGECKVAIESWLARPIRGFCYPNGDHDDRVVAAVREAGYGYAPTVGRGTNAPGIDPLRLRRIDMNFARNLLDNKHDQAILRSELALLHRS